MQAWPCPSQVDEFDPKVDVFRTEHALDAREYGSGDHTVPDELPRNCTENTTYAHAAGS
jgi:hypothetical protein